MTTYIKCPDDLCGKGFMRKYSEMVMNQAPFSRVDMLRCTYCSVKHAYEQDLVLPTAGICTFCKGTLWIWDMTKEVLFCYNCKLTEAIAQ